MAQNHWVATTREALNRIYGNGETVRRFEQERWRRWHKPACTPDLDSNEVPLHLGLLLIARSGRRQVLLNATGYVYSSLKTAPSNTTIGDRHATVTIGYTPTREEVDASCQ